MRSQLRFTRNGWYWLAALFLAINFVFHTAHAQQFQWAWAIGQLNMNRVSDVEIDDLGNIYAVGQFNHSIDIDPGSGNYLLAANGVDNDIFVLKLNANHQLVWAGKIGGMLEDRVDLMKVDRSGNVFVGGSVQGTMDIDPGVGNWTVDQTNGDRSYVVKLDSNGQFAWAAVLNCGGNPGAINSIATDQQGNLVLIGSFSGSFDFDPGPGLNMVTSTSPEDGFIWKLDPQGQLLWVHTFGSTLGGTFRMGGSTAIINSQEEIIVFCGFRGTVDFDPGAGTFLASAAGFTYEMAMLKLSPAGTFVWADTFGPSQIEGFLGLGLAAQDSMVIALKIDSIIDADPGPGVHLIGDTLRKLAFLTFDPSGSFVRGFDVNWYNAFLYPHAFQVQQDGLWLAGSFQMATDFDPGPDTTQVSPVGYWDGFMLRLDMAGNLDTLLQTGGVNASVAPTAMALGAAGEILVGGYFTGNVDFRPGPGTSMLSNQSYYPGYLQQFRVTQPTGLNDAQLQRKPQLYPNPSEGHFVLAFPQPVASAQIRVLSMIGTTVFQGEYADCRELQLSLDLPAGSYLFVVQSDLGRSGLPLLIH